MFVLDVSVVVARFRADHPHHDRVRRWTDHLWDCADAFTVPVTVDSARTQTLWATSYPTP